VLLEAAEEAAVPMLMASLVHDRFVAALALGLAEADWAAIARIVYPKCGSSEAARLNQRRSPWSCGSRISSHNPKVAG